MPKSTGSSKAKAARTVRAIQDGLIINALSRPDLIAAFRERVQLKLDLEARDKGYDESRAPGLLEITHDLPHPIAEIIYKAVRYAHLRDPNDLAKIAAWAELEWVHWHSHGPR